MGQWGVRSYENDIASDALDAGFDRVHGAVYEDLMDDRNPLTPEQVQQRLANLETLLAAVQALSETYGEALETWSVAARLALAGVVVRHAELGIPIPEDLRDRARSWLQEETIDWHEATLRSLRREAELALLKPS